MDSNVSANYFIALTFELFEEVNHINYLLTLSVFNTRHCQIDVIDGVLSSKFNKFHLIKLIIHINASNFTVIVGEIANFAAYAFAPAILVTPLGALSIIVR